MTRKIIDESGAEVVPARAGEPVVWTRSQVEVAASALLESIPDMVDDDGSGIYGRLLDAQDWEDLNSESKLPAGKDLVGKRLRVGAIGKRPSDMVAEDGDPGFRLDFYLVIDSVDTATGEMIRWQTSAPGLVLPLAKLHQFGKLPAIVYITQAEKPTKRGFRPINLTVLAVG